jgi:Spy/CpxP family protein refolding chaperone
VLEKYRAPFEALFEETRPRMHELREKMDAEFDGLLTDEQRARFKELKARRPPHGPGGPGGPGAPPPPPPPRE